MEVHPGAFVSNVSTNEWQPDPEVGGEMHVLVEDETAYAGMSRFRGVAVPQPWTLPERETILVLEGTARIEIQGGPTLELNIGDMASATEGCRDDLAPDDALQGDVVLRPAIRDDAGVAAHDQRPGGATTAKGNAPCSGSTPTRIVSGGQW